MATSNGKRGNGEGSLRQDPKSERWIAQYFDADGHRRKRSTGTTNRRDASEILAGWTKEVHGVRAGLIDADAIRRRDELGQPLADHVRDYFERFSTKPRTKDARREAVRASATAPTAPRPARS